MSAHETERDRAGPPRETSVPECTRLLFFAPVLRIFIVDRRATKPSHSKGLHCHSRFGGAQGGGRLPASIMCKMSL